MAHDEIARVQHRRVILQTDAIARRGLAGDGEARLVHG